MHSKILKIIRERAGEWPGIVSGDNETILKAILHERQVELFSEWGHRWLDLKRSGIIDIVMNDVAPHKGSTWNTNWQWYPIPLDDIKKNINLLQNAGY